MASGSSKRGPNRSQWLTAGVALVTALLGFATAVVSYETAEFAYRDAGGARPSARPSDADNTKPALCSSAAGRDRVTDHHPVAAVRVWRDTTERRFEFRAVRSGRRGSLARPSVKRDRGVVADAGPRL